MNENLLRLSITEALTRVGSDPKNEEMIASIRKTLIEAEIAPPRVTFPSFDPNTPKTEPTLEAKATLIAMVLYDEFSFFK